MLSSQTQRPIWDITAAGTLAATSKLPSSKATRPCIWSGWAPASRAGRSGRTPSPAPYLIELVETISDPNGDGIHVVTPSGLPASATGDDQIGDNEPNAAGQPHYGYRLNGVEVQPYWSEQDQAYIVPDGRSQNFVLDPIWNGANFTGNYRTSGSWSNIDGQNDITAVAIDSNDTLFALNGIDHCVYRYDGG